MLKPGARCIGELAESLLPQRHPPRDGRDVIAEAGQFVAKHDDFDSGLLDRLRSLSSGSEIAVTGHQHVAVLRAPNGNVVVVRIGMASVCTAERIHFGNVNDVVDARSCPRRDIRVEAEADVTR